METILGWNQKYIARLVHRLTIPTLIPAFQIYSNLILKQKRKHCFFSLVVAFILFVLSNMLSPQQQKRGERNHTVSSKTHNSTLHYFLGWLYFFSVAGKVKMARRQTYTCKYLLCLQTHTKKTHTRKIFNAAPWGQTLWLYEEWRVNVVDTPMLL